MSRRKTGNQMAELARELSQPRRGNPVLALYRWRYEVATAIIVPITLISLDRAVGPLWLVVILFCLASSIFHWPAARRFTLARVRAVIVQHRLRTAFARARVTTLDGRRPAILWVWPRGSELRVLLACPAGVDISLIREHRNVLASACFASTVAVDRHPRFAHLVVLTLRSARS